MEPRRYLDVQQMANLLGIPENALWWILYKNLIPYCHQPENFSEPAFILEYYDDPGFLDLLHLAIFCHDLEFGICGGKN